MKGQETISTIQRVHDYIQDSNQDTIKALLALDSLDVLPEGSSLKSLYDYLLLHHAYIVTALDDIDQMDQSCIYED